MEDDIENIEMRPANARRTFTLRNNVARQVVNFMPSRQNPHSEYNYSYKCMAYTYNTIILKI